jgi:tripartite-type tricarboxylate transporter receptor subunit TctC
MLRTLLGATLAAGLSFAAQFADADDYPSRSIRFLQGFAPGGNADVISRVLGDELGKILGQPVVTEARPGAGGNLASEQVARAAPDGYTIVLLTTAHVISPGLYKSLSFDPVKDFEFISTVSDFPFFIVVNAESPYRDVKELVSAAREKPGTLTYGTAGLGTGQHMCGELFAISTGTKMIHVPFRGDSAAVAALLGKNVDFIIAPGTAILGNIEGGKFRALAISGSERWPSLKDVPTVAETVAPGYEVMAWVGAATTRGVPKPVISRLNKAFQQAIGTPIVDKRLRDLGGIPRGSTPEEMTERVASQIKRWTGVIQTAGIQRQ